MLSPRKHNPKSKRIQKYIRRHSSGVVGLFLITIASFLIATDVDAAPGINEQISFQGKVVNTNGTNVANGSYNFLFCLYTTASPATPCTAGADNDAVWRESKSLTVTDGIFQSNLGDTTTLPGSVDFNTDNIYLGINFNSDGQMSPLVRFTAAPYALNAAKVGGLTVTDTTGTLTIPNSETISFGGSFSTTASNDVALTTSGSTTLTLPTTGTLATLAGTEVFTNKSIGSTGLTFSGATTDITTASGESLIIVAAGAGVIDLQDATTVDSLTTDTGGVSIAAGQSYTGAGAVTLSSAATTALTVDSGTTGALNFGTGNNAKTISFGTGTAGNTINIGTDNTTSDTITIGSALDNVALTGDQWSINASGAGAFASLSSTGAIAANGGITFDASTDTVGAFTAAGTIDLGTNILTNIGNTGTDFVASTGALTLAGVLTANGGISLSGSQSLSAAALAYVDLGLIVHNTTANQGLRLPQAASASPSNPTSGEGYIAWDAAGNQIIAYNGSAWSALTGGSGYATIQDEGSGLTARTILNFTGAGVSCADNGGSTRTDCTISGGGSADLQTTYGTDADGSDATISLTTADDSLVFTNPTASGTDSAFLLYLNQQHTTGAISALDITQASSGANAVNLVANAIDAETGLAITTNGLTSGSALSIASSASAFTGALQTITLSGSNSANTGSLLSLQNTGTANTNTSLLIQHNATGTNNLAFRVNDVAADTTPFVIDGAGNVGIGTAAPTTLFELYGTGSADAIATLTAPDTTYDPIMKFRTGASPSVQFTLGVDNSDSDKFKIFSGDGIGSGDEFVIDSNGVTTIANLNLGATSFDENAGIVSWIDLPVTASAASTTVESYSAQVDGNSFLTIYAESDGSGSITSTASTVRADVQLDATADGVATKVVAGACADGNFNRDTNGTLCVDSTNGRIYYRYGGAWHYTAQTAGFQIPNYETAPHNKLTDLAEDEMENALPFDASSYPEYLTKRMAPGEFLIPYVDEYLEDGAVHGLYARFDDVKGKLFGEEQQKIADLSLQTTANVTTLSEFQTSVDEQLLVASTNLNTLAEKDTVTEAKLAEHDIYFARDLARIETLEATVAGFAADRNVAIAEFTAARAEMAVLQEQVGTLTEFFNTLDLGNIVAKDELGNIDLLGGALKAKSLATGGITIEVADEEAPTIGTAIILPVVTDTDNDGKDDETGSDGKSIQVMTKAMIPMVNGSRIFTSFKGNPNAFNWVEKVRDDDGDYVGFKIRLSDEVTDAVKVDWWLIEQKDTFAPTP